MASAETNNENNGRKRSTASTIFIALLLIVGLCVLLYPSFSDWWNRRRNASLISEYESVVQQLSTEETARILAEAQAYNDMHPVNRFEDVFEGEEEYLLKHPYDLMLDPSGSHVMGYIEVPKIGQRLIIGHGTGTETLERGVGHVEGSSLPIGGPGTHSVLAGHRGLPRAKIFSDLDQIETGDKFFLYILDDVLAYQVDQIEIVEPNDDQFLQIEPGEDLVTLLTCTPYSINSHRLLVRGHRIPYDPGDVEEQAGQKRISERERPVVIAIVALAILLLVLLIVRLALRAKDKREQKKGEPL